MKNLFWRLALFASVFLSLGFLLNGCLPSEQKLKVDSEGNSAELNVRVGDVLPMLKIPLKEGYSFVGWKQNGTFIDVETPLSSIETLSAEYVENTKQTEGLTFRRLENGLSVTGIDREGAIDSVIIPAYCESFDGSGEPLPVVSIGENAFRNKTIGSLVFPDTLREISASAFENAALSHPFLPSSLQTIGSQAFRGASGFMYFDVPEGVTQIAEDAFTEMKNTAFRSFGKKFAANEGALFEGNKLTAYPAGAAPREYAVPDYVSEIGAYAFYRQTFSKLSFGENCKTVGRNALKDASVTELDLKNAEVLEDSALSGLTTSVLRLPKTLKFCGELALSAVSAKRVVFSGSASYRNPGRPNAVLYAEEVCLATIRKLYPSAAVFSETLLFGGAPMIFQGKVLDCPDGVISVTLDEGVTEIAAFALRVPTLETVTFLGAPPVFGAGAFPRSAELKIYVPSEYLKGYRAACPEYEAYFVGSDPAEEETEEATVTFTVDGHTETKTVETGGKISLPVVSVAGKTFLGWNFDGTLFRAGEEVAIEGDSDFVAEFQKTEFLVRFYADGSLLFTQTVSFGESAEAPTPPAKSATKEFDFSFDGWDKPFGRVTEDLEINAVYRSVPRYYTVEFYVEDVLLKTDSVRYGEAAAAPPDPEKEPTEASVFVFEGWDKPFSCVTEPLRVSAVFSEKPRSYTVTYRASGETIKTERVEYGKQGAPPEPPFKPSTAESDFVFRGWDQDVLFVRSDLIVEAMYDALPRRYTVAFYCGETLLKTERVEYGKAAAAPEAPVKEPTAAEEYRFSGWDKDFSNITEDTEVNAVFETVPRKYAVRFYAEGILLTEETVAFGNAATAPQDPEKASTASADFRFVGWDKDFTNIVRETEVFAVFEESAKEFTVSFFLEEVLIKEEIVAYGGSATPPPDPVKAESGSETYRFVGWDGEFGAVTKDAQIRAVFEAIPKTFEVRFYLDGALLAAETVRYGCAAPTPESPAKASDAEFAYIFVGWDADVSSVKNDLAVNALFREEKRTYSVKALTDSGETVFEKTVAYGAAIGAVPTEWNGKKILRFVGADGIEACADTIVTGDALFTVEFAEDAFDPYAYTDGLEFQFDFELEAYAVSYYYGDSSKIVIPERYRGAEGDFPVVKIGRGVFGDRHIDALTLPETLLIVEGGAFYGVTGISKIVLPKALTTIGANAFSDGITLVATGGAIADIGLQDDTLVISAEGALFELYSERFRDRWDLAIVAG